jgi:hypothetical protein
MEAIRFAITHYGGRMSEVARLRGNPATPPAKRLQRRLRLTPRQN